MQALILAAGMGKRLGDLTKENTKCMLEINGKTLIEQSLEKLNTVGITKLILVVGYKQQNVKDLLGNQFKNIEIVYVENPDYATTNNIYSLYLAKDYLIEDDTILLESDLIFDVSLLEMLLDDPRKNLALVDKYQSWMDGTVVKLDAEDNIVHFIPKKYFNYNEREQYYKTVNIYKFSKEFSKNSYVPFLTAYSIALGNNEYYEQVLRIITTLEDQDLKALRLSPNHKWYEIDDIQDKDNAESVFAPSKEIKLKRMQQRHGGYWRFPYLKDFCCLINPYFPIEVMEEEIKAYFYDLVGQYPSGLPVQNLLASKLFEINIKNIIVGNGVVELIQGLSKVLKGTCGIVFPSLNEYADSFGDSRIVPLELNIDSLSYTIDDILSLSEKCDTVLLINPDNPSGNFISKKDVIKIARELSKTGKRFILDESFVDFTNEGEANSLIEEEIINAYPNLTIIKNISNCYGIPGVRLGVLVTSDMGLMNHLMEEITIWNVNSFGEFFLQIVGKYKKGYVESCRMVNHEKKQLAQGLKDVSFLSVHPSEANYLLCHVKERYSSSELAGILLDRFEILIKDLKGKKGIGDNNSIRIVVRNKSDNDYLLASLKQLEI